MPARPGNAVPPLHRKPESLFPGLGSTDGWTGYDGCPGQAARFPSRESHSGNWPTAAWRYGIMQLCKPSSAALRASMRKRALGALHGPPWGI